MVQKFKTNRFWLTLLAILLYSLGAYITSMEKGMRSLPALAFFAVIWCFFLASGWNNVYLYKNRVAIKNDVRFWRRNPVFYFTSINVFDIVEGSRHYYELIIYLKNGKKRIFAISNQIDPYDLLNALKEHSLEQKK